MKVPFQNYFIYMLLLFSSTLCAEEITFDTNVKYKKNEATEFVELKAQQPLFLKAGDKAFVNTNDGIPFIVFSSQNSSSKINIPNSQISLVALEQTTPFLEKTTSDIIEGVRKVDNLISKRDYALALTTVTVLKEKYKGLSTVLFLSGTANYLNNNKQAAIKDLEGGLAINPENSSAKKLLEKIKKEL
jgi:hypothetical protein